MIDNPRFLACLPFTLAQECPHPENWCDPRNFSNDAHDPGGKTFAGIIQREYDAWRKAQGLPARDVRQLTQDEGEQIYLTNYWLPECPRLPRGLDLVFFDAAVNEGVTEATKILQVAIGVEADGLWGQQTQGAIEAIRDVGSVIETFTQRRETVYQMMPGYRYFGSDWMRRSAEIGAEALRMAA
jgi:lysozyme family protein